MEFTDFEIGDRVVYPGRAGSSVWMNHAVVMERGRKSHHMEKISYLKVRRIESGYDKIGRLVLLTNLRNVVVLR